MYKNYAQPFDVKAHFSYAILEIKKHSQACLLAMNNLLIHLTKNVWQYGRDEVSNIHQVMWPQHGSYREGETLRDLFWWNC